MPFGGYQLQGHSHALPAYGRPSDRSGEDGVRILTPLNDGKATARMKFFRQRRPDLLAVAPPGELIHIDSPDGKK